MSPERIPWGVSVPPPIEDIKTLVRPKSETILVSLGCGKAEQVVELQAKLGGTVVGCDIDPALEIARRTEFFDDDRINIPINLYWQDVTGIDNYLIASREIKFQLTGQDQGTIDAVLANNLFSNLTATPFDAMRTAISIAYGLKRGGWVFVIDHLLKDRLPFGNPTLHRQYRKRYVSAYNQGRPWGDVWTESPPRWVHHYNLRELQFLFPDFVYGQWKKFQTEPYTGDSGNTTNSFYLVAQKKEEFDFPTLGQHFIDYIRDPRH